jgi:hypothetical protein
MEGRKREVHAWAVGYLHHFRVWGKTEDGCTFTSYGSDDKKSFDSLFSGMEVTTGKPMITQKKAASNCTENGCKVDCVAFTSKYKTYFGLAFKGLDISLKVISSTITLRVCADGTKSVEDKSFN